ncbi:MAG: nucleotidyltransferase family protein [Bacteroidales bacterium]|nr:nucleotidyltransferase family protein [Bacteroidales bacterium]
MKKRTSPSEQTKANDSQARADAKFHLDYAERQNRQRPTGANSQKQIEIMLELLRAAVLDRDPVLDPAVNVDWDDLMDRASKQGILAWVYDGISKLPKEQQPPRQQRINWALSAQEIWDRYHKQKEVLADMVRVCDENGMRMLLLKGIGLSELYPKPESRPSGDIDVFFYDDFEKANDLLGRDGFVHWGKHDEWQIGGIEIENHKNFINVDSKRQRKINQFLLDSTRDSYPTEFGFSLFPPEVNFIFLMLHAMEHFESAYPVSYKTILDLGMFLLKNQDVMDPRCLFVILKKFRLEKSFELLLQLSEYLLGIRFSSFHITTVPSHDFEKAIDSINTRCLDLRMNHGSDYGILYIWSLVRQYSKMRWKYKYLMVSKLFLLKKSLAPIIQPSILNNYRKLKQNIFSTNS